MFSITFTLKDKETKDLTPIIATIYYDYKRLRISTGKRIQPDYWLSTTQRAKQSKKDFPEYPEFNEGLNNFVSEITSIYNRYLNDNDNKQPSPERLKELIDEKLFPGKKNKNTVIDSFNAYYTAYVEKLPRQLNKKTNTYIAPKTIQNHKRTLDVLNAFKRKIPFEKVDLDFYEDFKEHLKTEHGFSLNTIGKHIKNIKSVLIAASEDYKQVFVSKRFKSFSEETHKISLTVEEIQAIENTDLKGNEKLENVRDLFIIQCWTGLRFSDLYNLKPEHIGNNSIRITQQKTRQTVATPILPPTRRILDKYITDGVQGVPRKISNQKFNDYVKELGQLVSELHATVTATVKEKGFSVTKDVPKYEAITTHTGRRSFATNQYKAGVPTKTIMMATGHKSESEFFKYIRLSPEEHVQQMIDNYERKMKVV